MVSTLSLTSLHKQQASGLAIVVVDDQLSVRNAIAHLLRSSSLPISGVHVASNGEQALAVLGHCGAALVLLDVNLGEEDGLALLPQLVELARVVVFTSNCQVEVARLAYAGGAVDVVSKAVPARALLTRLRELCDQDFASSRPASLC